MSDPQPTVKKLVLESYLAMVRDSLGARVWQHYYCEIEGVRQDIMDGGSNACAWFVSGILVMHRLIGSSHATVASTVKDLEESGWLHSKQPQPGSIILYEALSFEDGSSHTHLAIYLGDDRAVSTSYADAVPKEHDWRYRDSGERAVAAIYHLPSLINKKPSPLK